MRLFFSLLLAAVMTGGSPARVRAQDLAPRAYIITPLHWNAVTLTYSFYDGDVLFDGAAPITNASAKISVPIFTLYHSLHIFGHSANVLASLPYGVGNFQGNVAGEQTPTAIYRSGLLDSIFRFSVNLRGGPAMDAREFSKWRQKLLIGVSLKVVAPTGQYDPTKLVNFGSNHWAFKPEVGLSRKWGHWVIDGYGGAWLYTRNSDYFSQKPGVQNVQTESAIGSFEGHLSYDVKPRFWASLDGNFWFGGSTSVNGIENPNTLQRNSRVGGTLAYPIGQHQSLKLSYSRGSYVRFGGDFSNVALAWQYSWLGRPQ